MEVTFLSFLAVMTHFGGELSLGYHKPPACWYAQGDTLGRQQIKWQMQSLKLQLPSILDQLLEEPDLLSESGDAEKRRSTRVLGQLNIEDRTNYQIATVVFGHLARMTLGTSLAEPQLVIMTEHRSVNWKSSERRFALSSEASGLKRNCFAAICWQSIQGLLVKDYMWRDIWTSVWYVRGSRRERES